MNENTERSDFEVEREVYHTQWDNIRHHWDETVRGVRYLATLLALAVVPLKFIRPGAGAVAVDPSVSFYVKAFVVTFVALLGLATFLNQLNHFGRSRAARKVVVQIEKRWNLYDEEDRFTFQPHDTKYRYAKFAGGDRRLITHGSVQFAYIVMLTAAGVTFTVLA